VSGSQTLTFSGRGAGGGRWLAVILCANCQSPPKNWFSMSGEPGGVRRSGLSGSGSGFESGLSPSPSPPPGGSIGPSGGA
jgi:hypothetical protein